MAKHCVRALRCFEHLDVTEEELHPFQAIRLTYLREAVEFVQWGMVPPHPHPCFNRNCPHGGQTEPIGYNSEVEFREYVISGLCAKCQDTAFKEADERVGQDEPISGEPDPKRPPCVWGPCGWMPIGTDLTLRTKTTIWAEDERFEVPKWVVGEFLKVVSWWERMEGGGYASTPELNETMRRAQPGDGQVVLKNASGRQVTFSTAFIRKKGAAGKLMPSLVQTPDTMRGTFFRSPNTAIDCNFRGMPTLMVYLTLTRVPGLDWRRLSFVGEDRITSEAMGPVAAACAKMMLEDKKERDNGTFDAYYAPMMRPQRRPLDNLLVQVE